MVYNIYTILVLLLSHTQSLPNRGYYLVNDGGDKPLVGRADFENTDIGGDNDNSWDMFGLFRGESKAKAIPEKKKLNNGFEMINSTKLSMSNETINDPNVVEDVLKTDSESKNEILK